MPKSTRATTKSNPMGLTQREMEVAAACLPEHLTNDEIAARLYISPEDSRSSRLVGALEARRQHPS